MYGYGEHVGVLQFVVVGRELVHHILHVVVKFGRIPGIVEVDAIFRYVSCHDSGYRQW